MKIKIFKPALSLCLLLAGVVTASASTVTYSFEASVPTINGPVPGSFELTVPDFVSGTPQAQFTGTDFSSCASPGNGDCLAQFSVGPSPISGKSDEIGFGRDNCCFIYFFPEFSFDAPGVYTADPFHSAGTATLTVTVNDASVPEPSTFGFAAFAFVLVGVGIRGRLRRTGLSGY